MKAKDLIKILEAAPEAEVDLQIGGYREKEYREMCAKLELLDGECLNFLNVEYAIVHPATNYQGTGAMISLVLRQTNYNNPVSAAEEFDNMYQKKED